MNRRDQTFKPEGFRAAWARWTWNLRAIRDRTGYYTAGERRRAWRDLSHSYVNWHVEGVRDWLRDTFGWRLGIGLDWLPKVIGKSIVGLEIGATVAVIATGVMVVT